MSLDQAHETHSPVDSQVEDVESIDNDDEVAHLTQDSTASPERSAPVSRYSVPAFNPETGHSQNHPQQDAGALADVGRGCTETLRLPAGPDRHFLYAI